MIRKALLFLVAAACYSCNALPKENGNKAYSNALTEMEKSAAEKQTGALGDLLTTISFDVKTDSKEFEDGIVPWASIEKPENDIPKLIGNHQVVIPESKVTVIIDYPLKNEYRFELESESGFTKEQLLRKISENYYKLYEEEESSATVKTIPVMERTGLVNRNQTDGKYGVWGHDITDLVLSKVLVYKAANGQIVLSLDVES